MVRVSGDGISQKERERERVAWIACPHSLSSLPSYLRDDRPHFELFSSSLSSLLEKEEGGRRKRSEKVSQDESPFFFALLTFWCVGANCREEERKMEQRKDRGWGEKVEKRKKEAKKDVARNSALNISSPRGFSSPFPQR